MAQVPDISPATAGEGQDGARARGRIFQMNVKGNPRAPKMFRGGPTSQDSWPAFQKRRGCKGELEGRRGGKQAQGARERVLRPRRLVPAGPASHEGSLQGHRAACSEGPVLCSAVAIWRFLIIFKGAPHFHCGLGPTKLCSQPYVQWYGRDDPASRAEVLLTEATFPPDCTTGQQEVELEADGGGGVVGSGVSCNLTFSGINI